MGGKVHKFKFDQLGTGKCETFKVGPDLCVFKVPSHKQLKRQTPNKTTRCQPAAVCLCVLARLCVCVYVCMCIGCYGESPPFCSKEDYPCRSSTFLQHPIKLPQLLYHPIKSWHRWSNHNKASLLIYLLIYLLLIWCSHTQKHTHR